MPREFSSKPTPPTADGAILDGGSHQAPMTGDSNRQWKRIKNKNIKTGDARFKGKSGDLLVIIISLTVPKGPGKEQQEDKELKINWKRVAITSTFGLAYDGPVGHYWYEYLDYYIRVRLQLQPKSLKFVTAKVVADGLLCGPLDSLIFFSYMGLASGKSMDQVKEDVKKDFLPAVLVEAGVWPFVQVANFRFVPVRYQLLYVNIFCLLDSTFLSWIEQQGDAPWKQWFSPILTLEDQKGQA
ncbi:PXMP2/4 family protein 4 [Cocos nucifera]|uniref:PXMP2/4 family protein 4 n=1 Tax=Cocos nucifera TaxID=13894 RepID=A0A8K0MWH9_COCNU|nr:PXMP2/4 family protein 4 [Cocos nucifera]